MAMARVTVAAERPSPRAAAASDPRSTAVTKARMASIRSIVAVYAISHCGARGFAQNLQCGGLAVMQGGYHEHLTTFVAIAKSGSLTRASQASGADQSTLSRRLAALE